MRRRQDLVYEALGRRRGGLEAVSLRLSLRKGLWLRRWRLRWDLLILRQPLLECCIHIQLLLHKDTPIVLDKDT